MATTKNEILNSINEITKQIVSIDKRVTKLENGTRNGTRNGNGNKNKKGKGNVNKNINGNEFDRKKYISIAKKRGWTYMKKDGTLGVQKAYRNEVYKLMKI